MSTSRRGFLKWLAVIPFVGPALVKLVEPKPKPVHDGPVTVRGDEFYCWAGELQAPNVVLAAPFSPGDKWMQFMGISKLREGDVLYFPKGYKRMVMVRCESGSFENAENPVAEPVMAPVERYPDKHSQRITLQAGDYGIILGQAGWQPAAHTVHVPCVQNHIVITKPIPV